MSTTEAFLLGVVATASFTAGLFFLKFWRETKDSFFLLFAAAFFLEALSRGAFLFLEPPYDGPYIVRLVEFLLILVAIIRKNYGSNNG